MKYLIFLLCLLTACSQEKCENDLNSNYTYRVELLDMDGTIADVRFCDNYYIYSKDGTLGTHITFTSLKCDRGRVVEDTWQWHKNYCIITKL